MESKKKSSAVDLVILGLLNNEPMSAYDLGKLTGVYELVKISKPAIYKNVHQLAEKGFLKARITRQGRMPEKTVYSITEKGRQHILELMEQCVSGRIKFHFDFNAFLLLVKQLPKANAGQMLDTLRDSLADNLEYLQEQASLYSDLPFPIGSLADQHVRLNKVLLEWLHDFRSEFESRD